MQPSHEHQPPARLAWRVDQFCQAVGVSRTKFYDLVKKKKIKTIVIGGRRLVPDDEARRILADGA